MNRVAAIESGRPGSSLVLGLPPDVLLWAIVAGAAVGAIYALSPLTVLVALAIVPTVQWCVRGISGAERRWVLTVMIVAITLRAAAIAGLLVTADPNAGTFAKFFGDEEFYQLRGLRLYNIWMGIPISRESFLYAYDKTGYTSYQNVLVFLQALVGPAPYGLHVLNAWLFLVAMILLYRTVRRSFGSAPALLGLTIVLFLPSVFMWSVSALKESLYLAMTSIVLVLSVDSLRRPRLMARGAGVAAAAVVALLLNSVRPPAGLLTMGGGVLGAMARVVLSRRWLVIAATVLVAVGWVWLAHAGLPAGIERRVIDSAAYHRGHVFTPGHSYHALDQRFYSDYWAAIAQAPMTGDEMGRYASRAIFHYVGEPLPWNIGSKAELAYLPEQVVWYGLVLLFPYGLVRAFKRDALLTCVLTAYALVNIGAIALNSGNIGTLVRHRALVIPFMVWVSAVGLIDLCRGRTLDDEEARMRKVE